MHASRVGNRGRALGPVLDMIVWILLVRLYFPLDSTSIEISLCQNPDGECKPKTYQTHGECTGVGKIIEQQLNQDDVTVKWDCKEIPEESLN